MTAVDNVAHAIREELDRLYPAEDPMEELKRQLADLTSGLATQNGAITAKLDMIQRIQQENVTALARMEEREAACQKHMSENIRALHHRIDAELAVAKDGIVETRSRIDSLTKMVWGALVAALGSVAGALWSILAGK